jgi:four helix bundle protein
MLRIFNDLLWLIRMLKPYFDAMAKKDRSLSNQGREALQSAGLNTGEGSGNRDGRRRQHYEIALGSLREAKASILIAEASGYITMPPFEVMDRIDKVAHVLVKLVR